MAKRKYFRKCGECDSRDEQSNMIRTNKSCNGWMCKECYEEITLDAYLQSEAEEF